MVWLRVQHGNALRRPSCVSFFSLVVVAQLMSGCLSNAHRERYEGLLADLRSQPASAVRLADDSRAVETQPGVHLQDFEKELILESAVATARRRNPEIIAMLRRWEVLTERIPQVGSLDDPQLTYLYNVAPIETRAGPMQSEFALSQRIPSCMFEPNTMMSATAAGTSSPLKRSTPILSDPIAILPVRIPRLAVVPCTTTGIP